MDIFTLKDEFKNLSKERQKEVLCKIIKENVNEDFIEFLYTIINIAECLALDEDFETEVFEGKFK